MLTRVLVLGGGAAALLVALWFSFGRPDPVGDGASPSPQAVVAPTRTAEPPTADAAPADPGLAPAPAIDAAPPPAPPSAVAASTGEVDAPPIVAEPAASLPTR